MVKNKRLKNKKAVSPVISTVLLIMIVIVLAIIILLWSRGFIKEVITKEIAGSKKRVNELCSEVKMNPLVNEDGSFGFENTGNIPIYAYLLKLEVKGSGKTETVTISNEKGGGVNPGFSAISNDPRVSTYSTYESIKIIPILLGVSGPDIREFQCPESVSLEV